MDGLSSLRSELTRLEERQASLASNAEARLAAVAAAVDTATVAASNRTARSASTTAVEGAPMNPASQPAPTQDVAGDVVMSDDGVKDAVQQALQREEDLGAAIRVAISTLQEGVTADLKAVVSPLSRYGKLLDTHSGADLPSVVGGGSGSPPLDTAALDAAVGQYLFRCGLFDVASEFCKGAGVVVGDGDVQPFEGLHLLLRNFRKGSLEPAIAWARENHEKLVDETGSVKISVGQFDGQTGDSDELDTGRGDNESDRAAEERQPQDEAMADVGDEVAGSENVGLVVPGASMGAAVIGLVDSRQSSGSAAASAPVPIPSASEGSASESATRTASDMDGPGASEPPVSGRMAVSRRGHQSLSPQEMQEGGASSNPTGAGLGADESDSSSSGADIGESDPKSGISDSLPHSTPVRKRRKKKHSDCTSKLEFQLHRLMYLDRLQRGDKAGALAYARETLCTFVGDYMDEVQKLMACLLYAPDLSSSPYKVLVDPSERQSVERLLCVEYCRVLGMSVESPFMQVVRCGTTALPVLLKASRVSPNWRELGDGDSLPVEIEVGRDCQHHSVFTCPVSREETTDGSNEPMILPCGHVLSRQSINRLPRGNNPRFKCPYCPSEQLPADCKVIRF